ncbi:MAG: GNAT family N-acetyltransferase, partial [Bacteroidales bacterium]|nr:GNAT family N-acetyltransferase [Bacteroidales bacterium]
MGESEACRRALVGQYCALWADVFGDSPEYIADVVGHIGVPVLVTQAHVVVSGTLLVPYDIDLGDRVVKAYYLYAVLTHPRFRGRGYADRLMHKAHDEARRRGADFCFLCPADDRLLKYYRYFGYTPNVADLSHCRPPIPDVDEYNRRLPRPAVLHSPADWALILRHGHSGAPRP